MLSVQSIDKKDYAMMKRSKNINTIENVSVDVPIFRCRRTKSLLSMVLFLSLLILGNNAQALEGDTPLHLAAETGDREFVVQLLDAGADTEAQNKVGMTPLYNAVIAGRKSTILQLLERGANINANSASQGTPLHHSIAMIEGTDFLTEAYGEEILESPHPSEVSVVLGTNIESVRLFVISLLLEQGADVNIPNLKGNTPLHFVALMGRPHIASLLIERGADISVTNDDGKTPLDIATEKKKGDLVKLLLKHGAG